MKEFSEIELCLEEITNEFLKRTNKIGDPLKAATIYQETVDELSIKLVQIVPVKSLFIFANQYIDSFRSQECDNEAEEVKVKAKIEILERALKVKSEEYLRELVPINRNIAQHALFSANPKNIPNQSTTTVNGVRSVHIKNNTGEVLTTYEARVMGAIQSLWFKQNVDGKPYVELKYADILNELGLTDGSANYKRVQEALIRLMRIEVTLTQYQRSKESEYEEIAFTRLIDQIIFRRKVGTTSHFQYKFQIRLPEWLVEANRVGNLFDISLILMNDLKSYLAQGLYWLVSSYPEESTVKFELQTLAGHFHFLDDNEPIMQVYKIVERIKSACIELQAVGFIERFEFKGKKQGLHGRYLTVTKHPIFLNTLAQTKETIPEQLQFFNDPS
ncbi:replication initiator protein A [Paenibacillus sp. FSL M7-0656]|uniref:replication initiator protein A n=1 Tax=Paenibacillus sp. FSL M7-0656 TaxID=2921534 RepID=UPI0030F4D010